jgi:hypothetical protein
MFYFVVDKMLSGSSCMIKPLLFCQVRTLHYFPALFDPHICWLLAGKITAKQKSSTSILNQKRFNLYHSSAIIFHPVGEVINM